MPVASVRRPKDKRWVEAFVLSYSDDAENWNDYTDENGNPKVQHILEGFFVILPDGIA